MPVRAAVCFFAIAVASCAGPTEGPTTPAPSGHMFGNGGGDGTGGNGTTTPPTTPPTTPAPDGGATTDALGCNDYVACLTSATSNADATACDAKASANAKSLLDAIDACVLGYCEGDTNADIRCQADAQGNPENLDGSPAFDAETGAPIGDCGSCLDNGEAGLWSEPCVPADDPSCNIAACAQATAACHADM